MCFGFRISSPLHLSTFQIPIQNFKYLKNAKNAWLSLQLSEIKLELCGLWFVSAPAVYSPKHEKCGKATHLLTIPQMWIMFSSKNIAANPVSSIWRRKQRRAEPEIHPSSSSSCILKSHAFLAFLGHFKFWMGIWNVLRCNGLGILNPKHMWKS